MSGEKFTGRNGEMQRLNGLWRSEGLVTCCIWGRRRVGKSRLLKEFSKGKRTLYMQPVHGSYYENLSTLAMDISAFRGRDIGELKDLSHLMSIVEEICSEEHTLVVIDELPYLLESAPQAASVIQKSLDRGFGGIDCMFVICGSSISMMRKETENYDRPLYGRFGNRMRVGHIELEKSMDFHPEMDLPTALKWYATVGGVPLYLQAAQGGTYESNLARMFFESDSPWKDDAPQAILQEFKGNYNYTAAVKCIADGSVRQSEIADKLAIDRAACKRILDDLEYVGIVEKRHPMANAPKKPVYRIVDPFIAFYYGIVSKNSKLIETSRSSAATYGLLRSKIDSHLGHMFEIICAKWLETHYAIIEIGSWWGKDSDGEGADIDIVAKISDENGTVRTLACECKFTKSPMGFAPLNTLVKRCESAFLTENLKLVLFSQSGFEKELQEYAETEGITLVDCETLMGVKTAPKIV